MKQFYNCIFSKTNIKLFYEYFSGVETLDPIECNEITIDEDNVEVQVHEGLQRQTFMVTTSVTYW